MLAFYWTILKKNDVKSLITLLLKPHEISDPSFSAYFICLCRPPGLPTNFFEEFQDLHIKDPPLPARSSFVNIEVLISKCSSTSFRRI